MFFSTTRRSAKHAATKGFPDTPQRVPPPTIFQRITTKSKYYYIFDWPNPGYLPTISGTLKGRSVSLRTVLDATTASGNVEFHHPILKRNLFDRIAEANAKNNQTSLKGPRINQRDEKSERVKRRLRGLRQAPRLGVDLTSFLHRR